MTLLAALVSATLAATPDGAGEVRVVQLTDVRGDDSGPGTYQYPTDSSVYPRGSFDLIKLDVSRTATDVVFRVTLGAPVRRPAAPARRTNAQQIPLDNHVYVQNVDIYIDSTPHAGNVDAVPGRNVTFSEEDAWDHAVVLTPQPAATRALLADWPPGADTVVASNVMSEGPTLIARVPLATLGEPTPAWAYNVVVTGAVWETSFAALDRLTGQERKNAFAMPVAPLPEAAVVGGAPLSRFAPAVLDLLTPPGVTQKQVLTSTDAATQFVVIRMVPADHAARATAARPAAVAEQPAPLMLRVSDVQEHAVVLERAPGAPLAVRRMGVVRGKDGGVAARVVITGVFAQFYVAELVEAAAPLARGTLVEFDAAATP